MSAYPNNNCSLCGGYLKSDGSCPHCAKAAREYAASDDIQLIHGDCLIEMKKIPPKSIDLVLCDPPYGTTPCPWDTVIPFWKMWENLNRITKDNAAVVLFGSEPFSSNLRVSNIKNFRYDWIWAKSVGGGFLDANKRPLKRHEIASVFYREQCNYNPQKVPGKPYTAKSSGDGGAVARPGTSGNITINNGDRYPTSILKSRNETGLHPTQKPVPLMEYLIKTYTQEGDLVLDFTMGSGSTGVAAKNLNRRFIGIEKEEKYFKIAQERIHGKRIE